MTNRQIAYSVGGALLFGLAIGRFSLPAKIVTKTEIKEVEKQSTQQQDNSHTVETIVKSPDGTVTDTIKKDNDILTNSRVTDSKDSKTEKTVTYNTRSWSLSGLAVTNLKAPTSLTYGGVVTYRLLGPIQVGGLGLSDGIIGVLLGIQF